MTQNFKKTPILLVLGIVSTPLIFMYIFMIIDSFSKTYSGSFIPSEFTFEHWRFLWTSVYSGRASIWAVTFNTLYLPYRLRWLCNHCFFNSRLCVVPINLPFRGMFLGGLIVLHSFPTITLIIAIFLILQMLGLYDTLIGLIMVKTALELPFGVWIMKVL